MLGKATVSAGYNIISYEELIADHDAIDRSAQKLLDIVSEGPFQVESALQMLWRLVSEVKQHVAREDRADFIQSGS